MNNEQLLGAIDSIPEVEVIGSGEHGDGFNVALKYNYFGEGGNLLVAVRCVPASETIQLRAILPNAAPSIALSGNVSPESVCVGIRWLASVVRGVAG